MSFLRTAVSEFFGLFIDDGALALLTLALIALVGVAVKVLNVPPLLGGVVLLVGYLAILAESVLRYSRAKKS